MSVQGPTSIKHFRMIQMLDNFAAKQKLIPNLI